MLNDGLPNQDTDKRSRYPATWITSILVALTVAAVAAVSTFGRSDATPTASDASPTASSAGPTASDASPTASAADRLHAITNSHPDTTHDPSGSFGLQAQGLTVHIYGTASDPDTARATRLVYFLGNSARETGSANQPRHSYSRFWTMPHSGTYRVTVVALNDGKGKPRSVLGSKAVKVIDPATRNPRGNATFSRSGTTLWVSGRLSDPDNARARLWVRAYDNGRVIGSTSSNGKQLYAMAMRLGEGVNNVSVTAFNFGMGTRNVVLGRAVYRLQPPWTSRYSGNQAIAAKMLASYGWGASEMESLVKLWNRESGWRTGATNPDGGAYGIPQALPSSRLASAGPDWRTNAVTQIRWGLDYIQGRYGSPGAAWAHEVSQGWY